MIPVELVNKIIMMSRPTYKYFEELNNKIEQYIENNKEFSKTYKEWANDAKEEYEVLNCIFLYNCALERVDLNVNLKPRRFIQRNL